MAREKPWELRRRLAVDTFARIREDYARASVQVLRLLKEIEKRLFDPDLQIQELRKDKNLSTRFAEELGLAPWAYLTQKRMELAGRMLTAGDHLIWQIGLEVGYPSGKTFSRAFTTWYGQSPTAFREEAAGGAPPPRAPAELVDEEELRRALDGDLPAAEADALLGRLNGLQARIRGHYHSPVPPVPREEWVEPAMAERLWRWIEVLPPAEQMAAVTSQAGTFHTPALFHRLCTESLEIGLENDVAGMNVAALALEAMNHLIRRLGKQPMTLNLFARAHAVTGHALRRSGYPDDAGEAFGIATRTLGLAGDDAHPVVMMELCLYQAMWHLERDELDHAKMLTETGVKLYEALLQKLAQQAGDDGDDAD